MSENIPSPFQAYLLPFNVEDSSLFLHSFFLEELQVQSRCAFATLSPPDLNSRTLSEPTAPAFSQYNTQIKVRVRTLPTSCLLPVPVVPVHLENVCECFFVWQQRLELSTSALYLNQKHIPASCWEIRWQFQHSCAACFVLQCYYAEPAVSIL